MSVNINKKTLEKSTSLGINVQKACENYLTMLNATIDAANNQPKPFLSSGSSAEESETGPLGFEPRAFSLEGLRQGKPESWSEFRVWLEAKQFNHRYTVTLFGYAGQFSDCLFNRDLSRVRNLPDSKRPNIMKALSALAKFTGLYEDWKILIKSYNLRWSGRSADDLVIDRLTSVKDPEEIWDWVKAVKRKRPALTELLDIMAVSGLRFIEGINSFNLIVNLSGQRKLILNRVGKEYRGGYFNLELSSLEHFWFRKTFLRRNKKAYVSFVPEQLVTQISKLKVKLDADVVQQLVRRKGLPLRFGDVREAHGTFMTKFLKESEINFLHGRATSDVFMANYFNPALIADLRARVFQGIAEIQEKVKA